MNLYENFNDENNNKYKYAFGIYLLACFIMYQVKKETAVQITGEEVIDAIKKSQTNAIYVVKIKRRLTAEEQI